MTKVTVLVYHNEERVGATDFEADSLASVGVYGAHGSAQYTVNAQDSVITVRFTGDFSALVVEGEKDVDRKPHDTSSETLKTYDDGIEANKPENVAKRQAELDHEAAVAAKREELALAKEAESVEKEASASKVPASAGKNS
jgi:hypothetical protein